MQVQLSFDLIGKITDRFLATALSEILYGRENSKDIFSINRTVDEKASNTNYAVVNGEIMNYNLCVKLYGKKG